MTRRGERSDDAVGAGDVEAAGAEFAAAFGDRAARCLPPDADESATEVEGLAVEPAGAEGGSVEAVIAVTLSPAATSPALESRSVLVQAPARARSAITSAPPPARARNV
jgi:hypothetical protein